VKSPDKLDLNYECPQDVAGRTFSNCYLQRKLSNGEVMQLKWLVYTAEKIGFLLFCELFSRFKSCYSFSGVELRGQVHPQKFIFVELPAKFLKIRERRFRHLCLLLSYLTFFYKKKTLLVQC